MSKGNDARATAWQTLMTHLAMFMIYLTFAEGDILMKVSMDHSSPVLAEWLRQGVLCVAWIAVVWWYGESFLPAREDIGYVLTCGTIWFSQMYCMVIGVKISNAMTFSAWQPLTPVVCSLMAVAVGYEMISKPKGVGIFLASGGALLMALLDSASSDSGGSSCVAAHFFFFVQVCCTSSFVIRSKTLLAKYSFLLVTMWSLAVAFTWSTVAVIAGHYIPALRHVYCQNEHAADRDKCFHHDLEIPSSSIPGVLWQIFLCGFIANTASIYLTKFVKPSVISVYTAVQPVCVAVLSTLHISMQGRDWADDQGIESAKIHHVIGTFIIGCGLVMVCSEGLFDEKDTDAEAERTALRDSERKHGA
eukprot:gnl/TRDRNA2_/TRDRNA2_173448_c0_seq6.p1 gnl/TRDRNA2_/TRDRNA2_173448_c0~~gnl/TRDRNA2_/TRDRNA2_173448_c0_seq6.p1  ORF type:complete len:361 (-),score=57.66 gnl/TRDRNA2_/TRDRNA2_173448_c0_seq6:429-1511(-)